MNEYIPKIILQISKFPIENIIIEKILLKFKTYEYNWFGYSEMLLYCGKNRIDEFPNIIQKINSFKKRGP